MRIAGTNQRKPVSRQAEAAILFNVGPYKFAIAATDVEEIRHLDGFAQETPVGATPVRKVRFTVRRERATYSVVDASMHFHMLPSKPTRVLVLRNGMIALTADSIDRMIDISSMVPLPLAFSGEERKWFRGLALLGDSVVPVVDPDAVLSDTEAALARRALDQLSITGAAL